MRAILEDPRSGQVSVYETPEPELRAGGILVRTHFSVISAGTERAKLEAGQKSLMGKALQRPDLVQQVIDYARANGVWAAYHKVRSRLDNLSPLGYRDRKSTRLNSSHGYISYAVFCLKKKKIKRGCEENGFKTNRRN